MYHPIIQLLYTNSSRSMHDFENVAFLTQDLYFLEHYLIDQLNTIKHMTYDSLSLLT